MISEICCNFKVLIYIELQTKIAMITEDKVTEIFCMADDFCKFFDRYAVLLERAKSKGLISFCEVSP